MESALMMRHNTEYKTVTITKSEAAEAEAKKYREALKAIIASQTERPNATVQKMVKIATEALSE